MTFQGTETTAGFLEYTVLYLIAHPEIQAKVFEEINRVVGNRAPRLDDREGLPYTQAYLQEVARFCPMGLFPPPRRTTEDVRLKNGMVIPKDTQVKDGVLGNQNTRLGRTKGTFIDLLFWGFDPFFHGCNILP